MMQERSLLQYLYKILSTYARIHDIMSVSEGGTCLYAHPERRMTIMNGVHDIICLFALVYRYHEIIISNRGKCL